MLRAADPVPRVEELTQVLGRQIFAEVRRGGSTLGWIDDRAMDLSMRDPAVRASLFQFIDVLPALRSDEQVARHLLEYYRQVEHRLRWSMRTLGGWALHQPWVSRRLAALAQTTARRLGRRFIAAATVDEALEAIVALRQRGLAATIDLLGEAVLSEDEASAYQAAYLRLIDQLAPRLAAQPEMPAIDRSDGGALPRLNVSIKLSSLYSQFSPADPAGISHAVRERLRPILRAAKERGAFVNIDMEQFAFKDASLRVFCDALEEPEFAQWADVGIAIQAYLRSCGDDLAALRDWAQRRGAPVWVRLVKGAYWDFETVIAAQNNWPVPVFTDKAQTDASFEQQTRFLLSNRQWLRPAIASHNVRSIAHAMALAEELGLPPGAVEFQMLYGMAWPLADAVSRMGQRVRIYAPWGELLPGMAYLVRRLLENSSNESFLRASFVRHESEEQLLMNPLQLLHRRRERSANGNRHAVHPAGLHAPFINEPLSDFARDDLRQSMRGALAEVKSKLGGTYPLVINGRRAARERVVESTNPAAPDQVVGRVAAATVEDAASAIAAAKAAFAAWRDTPVEKRAAILARAAQVMRDRRFELAAWAVHETAKPWREADADVAEAIDFCEYYARQMLRLAEAHRRDVPGEENVTFYEPRGVAVVIAPWNFPLAILCGMTAAALVAGNTVVMKPAEQSAVIGAKLMEVLEDAGLPRGVCNYLPGIGEEIGPALVRSPDVAVIAFTGSRAVGLSINAAAAEVPAGQDHLKHVICEMGGKNAVIIDEDADLDEAVAGVVASAFAYAGQKCSACSRAIVLDSIHDAFIARLIGATRSLRVGDPAAPANFVPPVIDAEAHARILAAIEQGERDATLVYPGAGEPRTISPGHCIIPHVFTNVPPRSPLAQEEIFGPVLAVLRARDLDEAIAIASNTRYALTGGLYSRSPASIGRVRRELRVGNLYINRKITGALVDRQPFGGFNLSGGGTKAGGPDYLLHFLLPRTITQNTLRRGFAPEVAASPDTPAGE